MVWPVLPISGRIDPRLGAEFHTGFYLIEAIVTGQWALAGDLIRHAILPAMALALPLAADRHPRLQGLARRGGCCRTMRWSRAPAASPAAVCCGARQCRTPPSPTVTLAGVQFTFLIGGTVLVERIFSYRASATWRSTP